MRDYSQIGIGREARRGYHLRDISIVPTRRTRDADDVSTAWRLDAFRFDIPMIAAPSDATMSPSTVAMVNAAGGLGVLNAEGLWTRYGDPSEVYERIAAAAEADATALLQEVYAQPVDQDLVAERIRELRAGGGTVAVRVSPQHTEALAPVILSAGVDLLVIQGTMVSAEHVSTEGGELNLKEFIADLDVPVVVGGALNYQTALHLMRTGAAGVIVGLGTSRYSSSTDVLGIDAPMATTIIDAAAARRDYLDETGGRYVHIIAHGDIESAGDIARAIACGADAVMLGTMLSAAEEAPGGGAWWEPAASHPDLPRGHYAAAPYERRVPMERVLRGPADRPDGTQNVFGALRRAMAKCGYNELKDFQRVELMLAESEQR
ncbi:GuaB3 family IMP dehydrogenase-related protein [Blastococcus sp. Marseille-P5729]|uniref:GuaB3 family IMP dehydrogenase-related protein n=1 Tax=Blastococcus sp. Marseille-P5729 TaxID=2086582 RepID=UPI000D0FC9D8|nr:GuaB3 family IMP dehydrogenase-related protein [Blastococcus sp. Marseille-P5729]